MEHRIGVEEAARQLAELVREAQGGTSVVLTRDGAPVAKLVPVEAQELEARRRAAHADLMAMLEKGFHLGGGKFVRDEAYDD